MMYVAMAVVVFVVQSRLVLWLLWDLHLLVYLAMLLPLTYFCRHRNPLCVYYALPNS